MTSPCGSAFSAWVEDPAHNKRVAWHVFCLALFARLAVVIAVRDWANPQDWEYGQIARNLLAGKGFSGSAWFLPEGETAFMAPGYVYLLCGFRLVFGRAGYAALQVFQAVAGAFGAVWLYFLARRVYGQRTAFLAGTMLAVYPTHVYLTTKIHPVILTATMLIACVLLSHSTAKARTWPWAVLLGAALGLAALTDPAVLCYAPVAAAWPLLARRDAWKRGAWLAMLALVTAAVVMAPWTVRNYLVFGKLVLVKSPAGFALWVGNHEGATGTQVSLNDKGEVVHVNEHIPEALRAGIASMSEPDAYNAFGKRAFAYMKEHPGETLAKTARKAVYYWWYPTWLTCPRCQRDGILAQFHHYEKIPWLATLCLAVVGVVATRKQWRQWILLVAPAVCYTALYAVTTVGSNSRYRFPVECLLFVFCAAGLELLWRSSPRKESLEP